MASEGEWLRIARSSSEAVPVTGPPITGDPARAAERFDEYAGAGASHLVLGVIGDNGRQHCDLVSLR